MENNYGLLINQNTKLHRRYFEEMCKLLGVISIYYEPKEGKSWTRYTEIDLNYKAPVQVPCIVNDNLDQRTMKKLGWAVESDNQSQQIGISVPYDLPGIQVGALFVLPPAVENAKGRLFQVTQMSTQAIYPASITCLLSPDFESTFDNQLNDHRYNSLNVIGNKDQMEKFI